jgi:hypothetical protein
MDAELNDVNVVAEQWTRGQPLHMAGRLVAQLRPDQIAQLLALQPGEGVCISLKNGAVYCYRGDSLPTMPLWLTLAPSPSHLGALRAWCCSVPCC